jgi:hypothetical protein
VEDEQRDRRAAWLTMVALLPLVIVGVGLKASIYGAVFGIPLLALVARPWWGGDPIGSEEPPSRNNCSWPHDRCPRNADRCCRSRRSPRSDDLDTATDVIVLVMAVGWSLCAGSQHPAAPRIPPYWRAAAGGDDRSPWSFLGL